jgi:hypothetical protein
MGMPGIIIKIGANTVDAVQGINRVDRALDTHMTRGEKFSRVSGAMSAAMIGMGAAAGYAALRMGTEMVNAALEDQKSMEALNTTLDNMGFGATATSVEAFIDSTQRATGVADDQLRPAFDRLVRSTHDVVDAQKALDLVLNIAQGTGKSVEAVAAAWGKALDGNTSSLSKLGLGLDAATVKSGDMQAITAAASTMFAGQAANAANTYKGQIDRLNISIDEAKETLGYAFLRTIDKLNDAIGGTGGINSVIDGFAEYLADIVDQSADGAVEIANLIKWIARLGGETDDTSAATKVWNYTLGAAKDTVTRMVSGPLYLIGGLMDSTTGSTYELSAANQVLANRYSGLTASAYNAANAIAAANAAANNQAVAARYTAMAVQKYQEHVSFTGGTLYEWKASLDAVNTGLDGGGGGGGGGGGTVQALDKVNPRLQKQIDITQGHIAQLTGSDGYIAQLKTLTDQQSAYADSVASGILGGINLSSVFDKENLGGSVAAFASQIGDVASFSTELSTLATTLPKSAGAQALIAQIQGLGVENGRALLAGLTTETATGLAAQLDAATLTVTGSATLLGNHFYGEGVAAAQQLVTAMTDQIVKDEAKLRAIGKQVGQPIGAEIKAAIVAAISEALAEGAAAQAAAVAGAVASAAAAITGDTYNFPSATVIDPVNVTRVLDTYKAQSRSRTGGP